MTKQRRLFHFLLVGLLAACNPDSTSRVDRSDTHEPEFQYDQWTVSQNILKAGPQGAFDDIAVKDPTIVFYNGNYQIGRAHV